MMNAVKRAAEQATIKIWNRFKLRWPRSERDIFIHYIQQAIDEATAEKDAEVERLRENLHAAASSLASIAKLAGKRDEYGDAAMDTMSDVRCYAHSRAFVAFGGLPCRSEALAGGEVE